MDQTNLRNKARMPMITIPIHRIDDGTFFHDIHKNKLNMKHHRVQGMETDEIVYADDTICISEDEEAPNR